MSCTSTVSRPRMPLEQAGAETRQGEHVLDHDGADEQAGDLQPEHRHDRDRRVAQPVPSQRPVAGEPTGASGAHEVLAQHLEHRRADVARQHGRLHERERDRRQDQRLQRAADALAPAGKAAGGQPAELHRDQRDRGGSRPRTRGSRSRSGWLPRSRCPRLCGGGAPQGCRAAPRRRSASSSPNRTSGPVTSSRLVICGSTGSSETAETPKSPWTNPLAHSRYCTQSGRSRPSW